MRRSLKPVGGGRRRRRRRGRGATCSPGTSSGGPVLHTSSSNPVVATSFQLHTTSYCVTSHALEADASFRRFLALFRAYFSLFLSMTVPRGPVTDLCPLTLGGIGKPSSPPRQVNLMTALLSSVRRLSSTTLRCARCQLSFSLPWGERL